MRNFLIAVAVLAALAAGGFLLLRGDTTEAPLSGEATPVVSATNAIQSAYGFIGRAFTTGGDLCTLTDANGGTYTLSETELVECNAFEFAAGGAGQAVIALAPPATSTIDRIIPTAGQCKTFTYDASALAAATTTTMTAAAGFNVIAYTTNDDVIDGNEFSQFTMCRKANTDINWFVSEMLHAD